MEFILFYFFWSGFIYINFNTNNLNLLPTLPWAHLPWISRSEVTLMGESTGMIKGNYWPWLIPEIHFLGSSFLGAAFQGQLRFRYPSKATVPVVLTLHHNRWYSQIQWTFWMARPTWIGCESFLGVIFDQSTIELYIPSVSESEWTRSLTCLPRTSQFDDQKGRWA